jgi:hypothetical protein
MKNKIFFSSIITIFVLINVYFCSVVGNNEDKSIITQSPLFAIRKNRIIDSTNKNVNCTYVGKGNNNNIVFPVRNLELSIIYRAMQKMDQMHDTSIRKKIKNINLFNNNMNLNRIDKIISILFQKIKNQKDLLYNLNTDVDNPYIKPFTIYRPLYLLILTIFILTFGIWLPFISVYIGITCDPCCFLYEPKTLHV